MGQWMAWGALLRRVREARRRNVTIAGALAVAAAAALRRLASRGSGMPPVGATGVAPSLPREQGSHIAS